MTEPLSCRICYEEDGVLIHPCACKGTVGGIHVHCLKKWVKESDKTTCEICRTRYERREVVACNIDRYCNGLWTFRARSALENALLRTTPLHAAIAVVEFGWIKIDEWMFTYSIQTLLIVLGMIIMQIFHHDVEFFVLNVSLWWSGAYLLALICVGTIRLLDTEEMCNFHCMKLQHTMCIEECPLRDYYERKEGVINNTMMISIVQLFTLVLIKGFTLCFTHMKKSQYRNRRNRRSPSAASGETSSLLTTV